MISIAVDRQLRLVPTCHNGNFDLLRHLIGTGWVDSEITSGFPREHLNRRENFLSLLHYFGLLSIRELRGHAKHGRGSASRRSATVSHRTGAAGSGRAPGPFSAAPERPSKRVVDKALANPHVIRVQGIA